MAARKKEKETNEQTEPLGRIEVAPEVLTMIAYFAASQVEGVYKMGSAPAEKGRPFRRSGRAEGITLQVGDDDHLIFDIAVLMQPHVDIMETSRQIQAAVAEAMDTMVGLSVDAVNVHVEDVIYAQGETV